MSATDSQSGASRPSLIASLGLWDVVAMNIVSVVGLRWIARSARVGAPSVTLWVLACLVFFVPLAAAVAEMSSRHPDQGGMYAWTRRAFGPGHGFVCGWCMWVNNLFYFPSLLLFGAANLALSLGQSGAGLADSRGYSIGVVLVVLWACTAINVVGFGAGKWVQHVGSIATWLPAGVLVICGAAALAWFGSATSFAPSELLPREDAWGTLSLWSAMCFAFSGFEIASMVGQEVRDPRRTIPRAVVVSGVAITAIYILSSASVLVAVPANALAERSGIAEAIDLVAGRLGLGGVGGVIALLLFVASVGGTTSWVGGAARVPFAAGVDAAMPAAFGRLHARFRTPHVALVVQAVAASALFLLSVLLSVGGAQTSVQEAYDILVNLTILIYFVPYLYLFGAYVVLRREPRDPGADAGIAVPGGALGGWLVAGCGLAATGIAMALVFVPPPGTENVLNYEVNLIGQAAAVLLVGITLHRTSRRRSPVS